MQWLPMGQICMHAESIVLTVIKTMARRTYAIVAVRGIGS